MYTLASEESYKDGQVIIKEGGPGDWVYVVVSGSVEISKTVQGRSFVIETLGPGEVFGELVFIAGGRRSATVKAVGDTTVGIIDRAMLDGEYNKLSSEFRTILVQMVKRFLKMIDRACDYRPRKDSRIPKVLSVSYKDRNSFVKAYTSNISWGGLFIRTGNPLPKGEEFVLKLQLPGIADPLKVQCQVAWEKRQGAEEETAPPGMGVRFMEMNKGDGDLLKAFVEQAQKR